MTTIDPQLHALYEGELQAISYPYSKWMDDLNRDFEKDQWIISKIQNLRANEDNNVPIANLKFKVNNGLLILPVLGGKKYSRSTMLLLLRATRGFKDL